MELGAFLALSMFIWVCLSTAKGFMNIWRVFNCGQHNLWLSWNRLQESKPYHNISVKNLLLLPLNHHHYLCHIWSLKLKIFFLILRTLALVLALVLKKKTILRERERVRWDLNLWPQMVHNLVDRYNNFGVHIFSTMQIELSYRWKLTNQKANYLKSR